MEKDGWFIRIRSSPLKAIEWILAIQAILGGLYIISPLFEYVATEVAPSALAQAVSSDIGIFLVGLVFLISGLVLAVGLIRKKAQWRATGLFINFGVRLYAIIVGVIINGFLPPVWLSGVSMLLILIIVYLVVKAEQKHGTTSS